MTPPDTSPRIASAPWKDDRPPHLPCRRGELPAAVLFPGDPGRVDRFASLLQDFRILGQNREYRIGVGRYQGVDLGVCSTGIGGPSTEIALVEAAGLGCRYGLRVGGTGALHADIGLGDLLIVDHALRGGGAASFYADPSVAATASPSMCNALAEAATRNAIPTRFVTAASTDSYYLGQGRPLAGLATNPEAMLRQYRHRGADVLDMEAETVLVIGKAVGLTAGALLAVHANRATDAWLEDFGPAQDRMLLVGCEALAWLTHADQKLRLDQNVLDHMS